MTTRKLVLIYKKPGMARKFVAKFDDIVALNKFLNTYTGFTIAVYALYENKTEKERDDEIKYNR